MALKDRNTAARIIHCRQNVEWGSAERRSLRKPVTIENADPARKEIAGVFADYMLNLISDRHTRKLIRY